MSSEETLSRDLRIKASMINLGERIAWGSETALMDAAADRIDALEAENARLERLVSHWQGLALMNRKVADDALAQLAAMQGGMGEVVEVIGWINPENIERMKRNDLCGFMVEDKQDERRTCAVMAVAQHQRITAAMAAEVEWLQELCECNTAIMRAQDEALSRVNKERDALAAELAIARRVLDRIGQLCTTPHESKERFIRRVQSVIEWQTAAQQDQPK